jgi:transcriptional regulator with XRE-family HTH domain
MIPYAEPDCKSRIRSAVKRTFDTGGFFVALDAQRRAKSMTWRDVAIEAGVSASTLTRMSQGKRPDVDGLASLLAWSGLTAEDFIREEGERVQPETLARISTYLRADSKLGPDSALALERIIEVAYEQMTQAGTNAETRVQERGTRPGARSQGRSGTDTSRPA